MKKLILILLISLNGISQTSTFKKEVFSKQNVIHVGKYGYIEKDKLLHSTVGGFVGSSVYMYSYYKTENIFISYVLSVFSAFVIGEAKELHDRNNGGQFSNPDLLSTTFGGFAGVFTKVVQIDIQKKNKAISKQYKEEFENLNYKK